MTTTGGALRATLLVMVVAVGICAMVWVASDHATALVPLIKALRHAKNGA